MTAPRPPVPPYRRNIVSSQLALCWAWVALALASTVGAQTQTPGAESLIGLWAAERTFGPEVEGTLTLWQSKDSWSAEIAGFEVAVTADQGRLDFNLPGDRGSFRGRLESGGNLIRGHWTQPVTPVLGAAYASPVVLQAAGEGLWRGEVRPLADRLRLYLSVFSQAGEDGAPAAVRAVLRNPERNLGVRVRGDRLRRQGNEVELLNRDSEPVASGILRSAWDGEVLSIYLDRRDQTFDFRRIEKASESAFYPANPEGTYRYQAPRNRGDGWSVATAQATGLKAEPLVDLVELIRSQSVTSQRDPYIHSLLIAHGGKLVLEEYFHGHGPAMVHDTRSAGKSLASMLAGAALDRHPQMALGTTVQSLLGDLAAEPLSELAEPPHAQRAAWRRQMNLGHLLSMRAGLDCDDNDQESPGNEDRMQSQTEQPDWLRFALGVPMARQPGKEAFYCSTGINLALATIARQTEVWWPEAFAAWLAEPLGIERYYFNLTPTGEGYLGGGIRLTPRDQLKLAQVMLDDGQWQGQRILSQTWVEQSLTPQASVNGPDDYGYGWWLSELTEPKSGQSFRVFNASGNGGQLIIGIPELDLVVQFSAGNYSDYRTWSKFLGELVPRYVLPAATSAGSG